MLASVADEAYFTTRATSSVPAALIALVTHSLTITHSMTTHSLTHSLTDYSLTHKLTH